MHTPVKDVFGEKKLIDEIVKQFKTNVNGAVLRGQSGTGKSFISRKISEYWQENGNKCIYLQGDCLNAERSLYPFNDALSELQASKGDLTVIRKGVSELAKGIPVAGDFVGFLVETIGGRKERNIENATKYLSAQDKMVIFGIDRIASKKELLIIADNVQYFDGPSLSLLNVIVSGKLNDSFPVFKNCKVLCVLTDDQPVISVSELDELLNAGKLEVLHTVPIKVNSFEQALSYFGYSGGLQKNVIEELYALTSGHIELIKKLAIYLIDQPDPSDQFFQGSNKDRQKFIEAILTLKLKSLGASGEQIITLLEYASVIGVTFTLQELACISKEDEEVLRGIIHNATENSLIEGNSMAKEFKHEIIREFFYQRLKDKKTKYLISFSECLAILHPADYYLRARYLFDSGNIEDSIVIYLMGYFRDIRLGIQIFPVVISRIEEFGILFGDYFKKMKEAYEFYFKNYYHSAIKVLKSIEDIYPKKLLAEKYYLLSINLSKTLSQDDIRESANCLRDWDDLKITESELWVRLSLTLMIVESHLGNNDVARLLERKVMLFLSERIKYDQSALYNINVLRRKSSSLHVFEIAAERTSKAVDYFSVADINDKLIYPVEFYMSINNHAGNLLVGGDFELSFQAAGIAVNTMKEYSNVLFPRPMVAANNFIISGILSKKISPEEALVMFESTTSISEDFADQVLLKTNKSVSYILAGQAAKAEKQLEKLYDTLLSATRIDDYYFYFVAANLSSVKIVNGKKAAAKKLLEQCGEKIPDIPDKAFLIKRHQLLSNLIKKEEKFDIAKWNNVLIDRYPNQLGKAWEFYGKGFLFSDIQYWSDS